MNSALPDLLRLRRMAVPLVAAALTAALAAYAASGPGPARAMWPLGALLLGLAVIVLVWWRQRPVFVLAAAAATAVVYYFAGFPPGPETVPFVVALVTVAASGRRMPARAAALAAAVVAAVADRVGGGGEQVGDVAAVAGTLAAVVALGEVYRVRRSYSAQSRARAVEAERLRIARELHDAVSHQLAVINLAGGGGAGPLRHPAGAGVACPVDDQPGQP